MPGTLPKSFPVRPPFPSKTKRATAANPVPVAWKPLPLPDGSRVGSGCLIAQSGNSSPVPIAPHLHFEVQQVLPLGQFPSSVKCIVGENPMACIPVDPYGWNENSCLQDPYATNPGVRNAQLWNFRPYLSMTVLCFGNQMVGTSSAISVVTLTNVAHATLIISSPVLTGANTGDFAETTTCTNAVLPGGSCTLSVIFTPTATGKRAATVSITGNDGGSPPAVTLAVTLLGTGT